jgi:DNA-binding NarL/FixJ family response regulator
VSIRVLVADDQSMVRAGSRMLLSGESGIDVVAEAMNGREAVEKASRFDPDVVLMDIRMPELDGLQATREILAADPEARVLILTTLDLDEHIYELEVFRLIARGLSNAEIGERLFITDTTVKTHVTHVLQKLNLRDRVQAVVLAYETGDRGRGRGLAVAGDARDPLRGR